MKKIGLAILLGVSIQGCSDSSSGVTAQSCWSEENLGLEQSTSRKVFDTSNASFSECNMLSSIGLNIIQPQVMDLNQKTAALNQSVENYCQALSGSGNADAQEKHAKNAWKDAMMSFHRVDSAPIGPMQDQGRLIVDNLYAWPNVNPCSIDVEVERLARTQEEKTNLFVNVKGFGAVEYLLFSSSDSSTCPLVNPRFAQLKVWLEKPLKEKKVDRCQFAKQLTADLVQYASQLDQAWNSNQGNFSKTMVDGSRYPSAKKAVNELSDAIFAIEEVKDERIGAPLGLHRSCLNDKCEDLVEHRWSNLSFDSIATRIDAFESIFFARAKAGKVGFGFDDYLKEMDREDVAQHISAKISEAKTQLQKTKAQGAFMSQLKALPEGACDNGSSTFELCKLFRSVREISNTMKVEFLNALSLQAPPTYQGDND